jgi:hypothetical protein
MSTEPEKTSESKISYRPNYKIELSDKFSYKLLLQHQPGAPEETVNLSLSYPNGYLPTNIPNYSKKINMVNLKFKINSDKEVVLNFKKL